MRRIALAVIAVTGVVSLPLTSAYADPNPAASIPVPPAIPGQAVCSLSTQLSSIVGLTATASGYAVVDKANSRLLSRVYQMSSSCKLTTPISYSGGSGEARDPRDIQASPDGKDYWVADSGDSLQSPERTSIGLWKIPVNKSQGTLYHFTFPQGDGPYDADAMLIGSNGSPIFITYPLTGPAGIYVPTTAPNPSGASVPLTKAGQFTPENTGTSNKLGPPGRLVVTGGAVSPDGTKVVLRTYSDAYEWDVTGGDIVKTLTTGTPRITPLPDEAQGEAITYSHDGKYFLTVSDLSTGGASMLRYTPAAAIVVKKAGTGGGSGAGNGGGQSWFSKLSLNQLTFMVAAVGIIGLAMVLFGVIGITQARKRRPATAKGAAAEGAEEWAQQREPVAASAQASARPGRFSRDPERSGGSVYPGDRSDPPDAGYVNPRGGRDQPPPPRGRPAPPQSGGTYRSGEGAGGTYRGGADRGGADRGGADRGGADRGGADRGGADRGGADRGGADRGGADRGGADRGGPPRGGSGGGPYSGGSYSGGTYSSGGYEPPAPPPPPPSRAGGVARSHRPETRRGPRDNAPPPRRGGGGYSEEHDGFDDLRRLSE
jgi:hypothetical protein